MRELNLKPGPKIGEILHDLFNKVEKRTVKNNRDELLRELNTYSNKDG